MAVSTSARTGGRPRSAEADRAILDTTVRLLVEQGYDAMSIEGVAAAAGVGKTTIYRRYQAKRELVVAAISSLVATIEPPPDSGNTRADLVVFMRRTFQIISRGNVGFSMLGTLLLKEREDPELLALFRERVIGPRIAVAASIFRRGVERGELRPDTQVDILPQMLVGAVFANHVTGGNMDEDWLEPVLDTLWRGIAAVA